MRQFNFFKAWFLSFYSSRLYRDVGENWRGIGFAYLCVLTLICALPFTYRFMGAGEDFVKMLQMSLAALPTITIEDGKLSIDATTPVYVKLPSSTHAWMVIDPEGSIDILDKTQASIALTQTAVFVRIGSQNHTYLFSSRADGVYPSERVQHYIKQLFYGVVIAFYFLVFFCYLGVGLVEALFYALCAHFFIVTGMPYKKALRLAMVALTPSFMLAALFQLFSVSIPYPWVIYIPLSFGYLLFAMKANW